MAMRLREGARQVAAWAEWVGVVAVWVMLAFTVVDVVGAKVFLKPLRGSTDLVGFSQVIAISAGLAMACFAGRQIELEFLVNRLPSGLRRGCRVLVSLLSLALFVVLARESWLYGRSLQASGQIGSGAPIPYYPFAYALGVFAAVAALYFVAEAVGAIRGEEGRR